MKLCFASNVIFFFFFLEGVPNRQSYSFIVLGLLVLKLGSKFKPNSLLELDKSIKLKFKDSETRDRKHQTQNSFKINESLARVNLLIGAGNTESTMAANQRPVFRSRELSQPITIQYRRTTAQNNILSGKIFFFGHQ